MMLRIPVICLVGSSRFKDLFHSMAEKMEKAGILPLMMGFFQHADNRPITLAERQILSCVDRARIDLCEEVWVVDGRSHHCTVCGKWYSKDNGVGLLCCKRVCTLRPYIGEDTRREINYAESKGMMLRYLCAYDFEIPNSYGLFVSDRAVTNADATIPK